MKTISTDFVNQLDTARVISGAQAIIRANRLKFTTSRDISHTDMTSAEPPGMGNPVLYQYDCDTYSNGVMRVMVIDDTGTYKLAYQWIPHPRLDVTNEANWKHWVTSNRVVCQYSKPGVFGNRIFYHKSNGDICYSDFNTGTLVLGAEVVIANISASYIVGIAPVSATKFYVRYIVPGTNDWDRAYISVYIDTGSWGSLTCPRVAYGNFPDMYGFDAISKSTYIDYIFFAGDGGKRADYIVRDDNNWSQINPVIDLDITDSEATFYPQMVSKINNIIFLTMGITRENGKAFNGFTFSAARDSTFSDWNSMGSWSLGRDIYIAPSTVNPGKLLFLNDSDVDHDELYYLGYDTCYVADATYYTGGSNEPTNMLTTGEVADFTIALEKSNPSVFQIYVGGTAKSSALLVPGNDIELYTSLGGYEAQLGTYNIDNVSTEKGETGSYVTVSGRGKGIKQLSQWTSDAYYDIWSQTKQSCNPALLTEMIRLQGEWDTGTTQLPVLTLADLNVEGLMYTAMRSSKNSIARVRFKAVTNETGYTPSIGLFLNMYRHPATDEDKSLSVSGLRIKLTPTSAVLTHIDHNAVEGMASSAYTMPNNTYAWLEAEYIDGKITVRTKADTATSWTQLFTDTFEINDKSPFGTNLRDSRGRPGIYVLNTTPNSTTPGFTSEDTVIPVASNTVFTSSDTVIVDDEQITITGKSTLTTFSPASDRVVTLGETFMSAPHDNAYWINGVILFHDQGDPEADQDICSANTNKYVSWTIRPGGTVTIDKIQVRVKKVGTPTNNLYCYIANDTWDDSSTPTFAAVLTTGNVAPASVGTTYSYVEITFATPQTVPINNYWLILTNVASGATPSVSGINYYVVSVDEYSFYNSGFLYLWDGPGFVSRSPNATPAFKLIGEGNSGDGYEIYFIGVGGAQARDYFDDCALVVTGGAGEGSVFKITDYDYRAPKQWVPSRQYVPPDRWQDHVGDLSHGAWVNPNMQRLFVSTDPSGVISGGSTVSIYPGLVIGTRGANGTHATSHSDGTVSHYSASSVTIDKFEYYSMEIDKRLEDVFFEVARKAGLYNQFTCDKHYYQNIVKATAGRSDVTSTIRSFNSIVKLTKPSAGNVIVCFRYTYGTGYSGGKELWINSTSVTLKDAAGVTLMSWGVPGIPSVEWFTVSIQENDYAVWYQDNLIAAYHDSETLTGDYMWIAADSACNFNLDWSKVDRRVDNFVMDGGVRGDQLVSQLINQKRFYFIDRQDGGIRLFRDPTVISGTYELTALASNSTSEQDLITRMRVMGLYEYETFDDANMAEYGNLYGEANIQDADTYSESVSEADEILNDVHKRRGLHGLTGAADPRVEPGDKITYNTGGGATTMKVESVTITLSIEEDTATFDMKVEGIDG